MNKKACYTSITKKLYECSRCGHQQMQTTNHYGPTFSLGRYSVCPHCPPFAKYPEYNSRTMWVCMEKDPTKEGTEDAYKDLQKE